MHGQPERWKNGVFAKACQRTAAFEHSPHLRRNTPERQPHSANRELVLQLGDRVRSGAVEMHEGRASTISILADGFARAIASTRRLKYAAL